MAIRRRASSGPTTISGGLEDIIAVFLNLWGKIETNKVVGGLYPNDGDGNAWGDPELGFPKPLAAAGYTLIDPGRYQNLSDDFSAQISEFQGQRRRDRHRCRAAAGLHHILDPIGAAGLPAQGGDGG